MSDAIQKTSEEASSVNQASDLVSEASSHLAEIVERFLADVTKDVEDRRKAVRKAFTDDVTVIFADNRKRTVQLIDVSATGAQILDIEEIPLGEVITLQMLDGFRIKGAVVRHTGSGCGLEFERALAEDHILLAA